MWLHPSHGLCSIVGGCAFILARHPHRGSEALELDDATPVERIRDPIEIAGVSSQGSFEALLELLATLCDRYAWTVPRVVDGAIYQSVAAHRCKLVAHLERERTVLVEN